MPASKPANALVAWRRSTTPGRSATSKQLASVQAGTAGKSGAGRLRRGLPYVVAGASPLLEAAGVASRCEVRGGDAFTAVPAGYETYLLSRVIHDWDDERSIALLTRSKQAMQPRGKVLLVERLILTGTTPTLLVLESDVQMLVVATSRLGLTNLASHTCPTHRSQSASD
jgi:O-methyltransferase domain